VVNPLHADDAYVSRDTTTARKTALFLANLQCHYYHYYKLCCFCSATVFGRGVYFASNFAYSAHATYSPPDANGTKYVYQSLVLTGQFVKGGQSMIVPPSKPSSGGAASRYDSVVDNETSPAIFVVFYDTQAYPQYLVSFK